MSTPIKCTSKDFVLKTYSCDITPIFQGRDEVAVVLLNPCDGWHLAYAYFDEETLEFIGFYDFMSTNRYEPDKFYFAWAFLPDEVSEMLPVFEQQTEE